jgi:putative oxidoreductase
MQKIFSSQPLVAYDTLTAIVRIVMGVFMIYHGWEVFSKEPIDTYTGWLTDMHFPQPRYWALLGKANRIGGWMFSAARIINKVHNDPFDA